jgi:hypothetical protein
MATKQHQHHLMCDPEVSENNSLQGNFFMNVKNIVWVSNFMKDDGLLQLGI